MLRLTLLPRAQVKGPGVQQQSKKHGTHPKIDCLKQTRAKQHENCKTVRCLDFFLKSPRHTNSLKLPAKKMKQLFTFFFSFSISPYSNKSPINDAHIRCNRTKKTDIPFQKLSYATQRIIKANTFQANLPCIIVRCRPASERPLKGQHQQRCPDGLKSAPHRRRKFAGNLRPD